MSELVDFERVERTHGQKERNELMSQVAQLYSMTNERIDPEMVAVYDTVLLRLADMVEEEALAFVAERLAPLTNAPRTMMRRLAKEPINVARPVLQQSPVLSDEDLVEIAGESSNEHLEAIAGRETVPQIVSAVLVDRGDRPVKMRLTRNRGADLSTRSYNQLVEESESDEDLQFSLAEREDLPPNVVKALIEVGTETVRNKLLARGAAEAAHRVNEAATLAAERLSNEQWLSRYNFDAAYRNVSVQVKTQPLTEPMLASAASSSKFAEAVVMFALMAGVPLEDVKHWSVRTDPKPFLVVAKAIDLSSATVGKFLQIGPWLRRLDRDVREKALTDYAKIDSDVAGKILQQWRDTKHAAVA
ncbi:MAG: DUF2336 domain-containing protein [Pseudomonadota bacterium]